MTADSGNPPRMLVDVSGNHNSFSRKKMDGF